MFEQLLAGPSSDDEKALIARIEELERLKSAAAAAQARAAAAFALARRRAESAAGVPARRQGRGVAAEVALARRDSPARGSRHLGFAQALVNEMPHTLAALEAGALSEWRATLIVRESACLDVDDRRTLDAELCADPAELSGLGDRRIAAEARRIAYRLDPHAVVDRAAKAETERTVTIRPAPDCMTYLTALLPMAQGVSVYAALKREADTTGDGRGRGQVMADTLVERITGRSAAVATPIAVNLVLSDASLLGGATDAATVPGYGPIPAAVARQLIAFAGADPQSRADVAQALPAPRVRGVGGDGIAIPAVPGRTRAVHRAARPDLQNSLLRCPDPPHRSRHTGLPGGPTTAGNGDGLCEACNYAKQAPGWSVVTHTDENGTHTAVLTTPTGGVYESAAPPIAGPPRVDTSVMEIGIGVELARHAA